MKSVTSALLVILCTSSLLWAAMSDGQAAASLRKAYGLKVGIASNRFGLDSNWNRMVQIKTPNCAADNTDLGVGFNTWESAFLDMTSRISIGSVKINGPYKGTVDRETDYPIVGDPTSIALYIDGDVVLTIGEDFTARPSYVRIKYTLDTTVLTFGLHTACLVSSDVAGIQTRREPSIFMVDQSAQ